ncbi:MAG: extracellular solute-binding protein [Gemmatimonadetes bacterium]|jgi:ABC-type glycerol-3-phosphate transport system substrate-binding protein|nr:extracellular solute-binding protein [Gemmatimonadota bacterium]MBT5057638.1 extracellular solute-binding protein [Gemmatimonadota bacterium]MBT5146146.1 extracellular solute-binding protein [Gemmatimonadota bacterium]MBT5587604.1 extracellular solute-binding protein [Gemmatimonadota bacterium]MBT5963560.1 extracellular solute-binding protein [Gemmatimonadota bacterium]
MKVLWKRITLIATLGVIGVLGLQGCAPSDEGSHDPAAAVDPAGQQVLFWYTHGGEREQAMLDLIDLFNISNPHGIQVTGEHVGTHADLYEKILLGMQGGPMPQIVEAYQNQAQAYYKSGAIVDLTPYMNSTLRGLTQSDRDDFVPGFIEQDNVDGAQTALLPNRSMEILYYNQDWLAELGAEAPGDWNQFGELARLATQKPFSGATGDGASLGLLLERDASRWAAIIYSMGGELMNENASAYSFSSAAATTSLEMLHGLHADGALRFVEAKEDDRQAFAEGRALFALRSSSAVPQFASAVDAGADFSWSVAAVPYSGQHPVQNVYGASLAVTKSTDAQQVASWLFVRWLTQPEQQDRWAKASSYFPVRRSVAHRLGPYFRAAYNLLEYGRPEPAVGGYEPVRALMVEAMVDVIAEGEDAADVLKQLETEANKTLKPYR